MVIALYMTCLGLLLLLKHLCSHLLALLLAGSWQII